MRCECEKDFDKLADLISGYIGSIENEKKSGSRSL